MAASSTPAAPRRGLDWTLISMFAFFSLQAATALAAFEVFPWLKEPQWVLAVAAGALAGIFGVGLAVFRKLGYPLSPEGCFFVVVQWSAVIDLILAFCAIGWTHLGHFYFVHGEEYFKTSWGVWALLWDGTYHYVLQVYLAYAAFTGAPRAAAGLLWAGSVINSLPVLLGGAATGVFSDTIKPATAANAPYIVVPIWIAYVMFRDGHKEIAAGRGRGREGGEAAGVGRHTALWCGDVAWGAVHAAAIVLHVWRALVALGSAHPLAAQWKADVEPYLGDGVRLASQGFLNIQILMYAFYYVPFHAWALTHSLRAAVTTKPLPCTTRDTLALLSMFAAGGYLQGQGGFLTGVAFEWVGFEALAWNPAPPPAFWQVQSALLLAPCAHAAWCWCTARAGW